MSVSRRSRDSDQHQVSVARIFIGVVLTYFALTSSISVFGVMLLLAAFTFPRYYEGIVIALLLDALFRPIGAAYTPWVSYTLAAALVVLLSEIVRKGMRSTFTMPEL